MTERLSRRTFALRFYREITEQLQTLAKHGRHIIRLLEQIMSNQEQLDARVAALTDVTANLVTGFDEVQAEVQALKDAVAAGQPVDFTGFDTALANLGAAVGEVSDAVPDEAQAPEEPPA